MSRLIAAAVCGVPVTGPAQAATDGQAGAAASSEEEIVVTGRRDATDAVQDFVGSITVPADDQIARFESPICPVSHGLPDGHGEVIEARLRQIADHIGLGSRTEGCQPNVIVIVADDAPRFIEALRQERPELFGTFGLSDLRALERLSGPSRAWQVTEVRGADGRPAQRVSWLETGPGQPPRYIPRGTQLAGVMPSLTQRSTRLDLSLAFVILDLQAAEGLTLLQLADHAAMRTLARTEPRKLPAGRSISTLFIDKDAGGTPAEALTAPDAAYLRAIYRTGNTAGARQRRSSIVHTMQRDLQASRDE